MIAAKSTADVKTLRCVYRELLLPSFRTSELLEEGDFIAQFPERAEAIVAGEEGERISGIAVSETYGAAVLLQYLAVAAPARGRGIGSVLMDALIARWSGENVVLLAEIDRPDQRGPHPLHGDPSARLRFYARFAVLALDLPYFQPPVTPDASREYGLLLTVVDLDGEAARRGRLTLEESAAVRDFLAAGLVGATDTEAVRLLDAARASDGIRVLPLDRFRDVPLCCP